MRWWRKHWSENGRQPGNLVRPSQPRGPTARLRRAAVQTVRISSVFVFVFSSFKNSGSRSEGKNLDFGATPGSIKSSLRGTGRTERAGRRELFKILCRGRSDPRGLSSSQEPQRLCDRLRHQTPADQRKAPGLLIWGRIKCPEADSSRQTYKES